MDLECWLEAVSSFRPDGVGLQAWSLCAAESARLTLQTKDLQTGNAHTPFSLSESCAASYLLHWQDGLLSRGSLERHELERETPQALAAARHAAYEDPDAALVLGPARFPDVHLHDSRLAAVAAGDVGLLLERLEQIRDRVRSPDFRTWSSTFHASDSEVRVITSLGLDVAARGTVWSWHVSVDGELGSGYRARDAEPLGESAARLDRLLQTVRILRRPAPPLTGGPRPVVLHPGVVEELVLAILLHHLDGATVAHGEGRFAREQFGSPAPVLREDLALRLDPLRPLRAGSYRFTMEGLPAAPCAYIDRGRLVTPVVNLKYSRRLQVEPTPIPYGLDALFLEGPGPLTTAEAFAEASGGVLVLTVLGVHTLDAASGDFSLASPQVLHLGAEGPDGRLRATISGNVFDLLRSEALRLVTFEGEQTPGLLVRCRLDPK